MKCFDCAYDPQNPYPVTDTPVTDACLIKSLVLFRPSEGIIARDGRASRAGEDLYLTGAPLGLRWLCADGQAHEITVPPGFVTDLTSVPALFRSLVSRAGPWLEAAIVHDFLYVAWQGIPGGTANGCDRRFADSVMLATMKSSGVGLLRRWCIFAAVRFGGGRTFRKPDHLRFGDATDPRLIYLAAVSDLMAPT